MRTAEAKLRRDALAILRAALDAVDAGTAVRSHLRVDSRYLAAGSIRLPLRDFDRIFLIAAGKAAAPMCASAERILGSRLTAGIAVTKHGHLTRRVRRTRVIEAGHPIPDVQGLAAAGEIRELLAGLNRRDLLLVALSGGASALLSAPARPVTLRAKQKTTDLLLRAGATIGELNAVRKHISMLKGGWLAAQAWPATVVGLLLSDVIGDLPDVIGSGPTAPDLTTFDDALAVLRRFGVLGRVPSSVIERLEHGSAGKIPETPKPGDPIFKSVHNIVIGSNRLALLAAQREAKSLGYRPLILSSEMQGETREVARVHAQILREAVAAHHPVPPPACILSGGETTVTVRGAGKGGRNQEFALAGAIAIEGLSDALILSAGTDGTDGPTDAAGAIATGSTLSRARRIGLNAPEYLSRNDSYHFFDALGDLVRTGPTGTNVMDIHMLLAS